MPKIKQLNIWYLLLALGLVYTLRDFSNYSREVRQAPYSEFETQLNEGAFSEVVLGDNQLTAQYKTPKEGIKFLRTNRVMPDMAAKLSAAGVQYSKEPESNLFRNLFAWTFPFLIMFWLWSFFARRLGGGLQGGMMAIGKSKAKIYVESDTRTTFADVAGADEAKMELQELVEFLKDPKKFQRLGGRMPKGVLLIGPPGTGKTLIAKAVAGEAGVPFFSTNGAEFVEMFVGVGAARVRDLFEQAKLKSPCIIFVDELDALGRARITMGMQGGNDEKEQTLNQLLAELDGFDSNAGIILLAATNRPEILDPALLRAGRFDRQVLVDKPDKTGRAAILKLHSQKTHLAPGTELDKIALLTPGFTGADLANLVNEASLIAVRRNSDNVAESDFTEAIERLTAGLAKKNRLINPFERNVVAHHEMGHALVSLATDPSAQIHKVSIIPRGVGALGYTMQRPLEERFLMTLAELENKMAVLLGGRASEKIIFKHVSTGAADDLDKATEIAWSAVTKYAMEESLGDVVFERTSNSFLGEHSYFRARNYSEATAEKIDEAVRELLNRAATTAERLLRANHQLLLASASQLLEQETLSEADIKVIAGKLKGPSIEPAAGASASGARPFEKEKF